MTDKKQDTGLSAEERKLLEESTSPAEKEPRGGRPARVRKEEKADEAAEALSGERGPLTPAQFDDDGWGDTPAQMRG